MKPMPASSITMFAVTTRDGSASSLVAAATTARTVAIPPPATWR